MTEQVDAQTLLDRIEHFEFLDALRKSGQTNMYGASVYLMRAFVLDRNDSREVLMEWMRTFDPKITAHDRAVTSCSVVDHQSGGEASEAVSEADGPQSARAREGEGR